MENKGWYSAHSDWCPIHGQHCPTSATFSTERCKIHGLYLQDYASYIETGVAVKRYAKPICLECHWLRGGNTEPRIVHVRPGTEGFFMRYGLINGRLPESVYGWQREFGARLQRYLFKIKRMPREKAGKMSLKELAFEIGVGPKDVLDKLREFEAGKPKRRKRGE